jgi:hypothetical protein
MAITTKSTKRRKIVMEASQYRITNSILTAGTMRSGGEQWKNDLRKGTRSIGLFLNSGSPTIAGQLSTAGYDWLLVDTQHGPMNPETLYALRHLRIVSLARSAVFLPFTISPTIYCYISFLFYCLPFRLLQGGQLKSQFPDS